MKLINKGAEAFIYQSEFHGIKSVVKKRIPKTYRNATLDERITTTRIKEEARMLRRARENAKISTPRVFDVRLNERELEIEFIKGKNLSKTTGFHDKAGEILGKLHANHIIHGDYTRNNILENEGKLIVIDFGLSYESEKHEDKATDLIVYKMNCNDKEFQTFIKNYEKTNPDKQTLRTVEKIMLMGRYKSGRQ
ncbi:KEOPS complex subunit Bud32 [uncultured archaeon]|nr:KEOPS complex subunit Bud32 [uncultured archaeon]